LSNPEKISFPNCPIRRVEITNCFLFSDKLFIFFSKILKKKILVLHPGLRLVDGGPMISVIELEFFSGLDVSQSDENDPGRAIVVQDLRLEVGVLARVVDQTAETAIFG
jgi:hypothetical protein